METEEAGWTKENLLKLLASLKASIRKRRVGVCYRKELETVDWNEVALPPFSPEQCQEKWTSIMKKIPKIRTLAELIGEAEDVISDPSHNTKIHPELPKRPAPPAAAFFQENLARLKNEHPKQKTSELMKISFERFSNLSDEEKAEYERKHRLAVKEYKTELKKFCKGYGKPFIVHLKQRKKKTLSSHKDGLPPKPVTNGYMLFCKEQSKSTVNGQKDVMRKWSKAWQELSETKKKKYLNQGRELKKQYGIELNDYLRRFDKEEQNKILKENGISRSVIRKSKSYTTGTELSNEPKKPSPAARTIFFSEKMKRMKDIPCPRDRFIKANKMWQNLSSKEKERYKAKVDEKFRQYADELQNWFQKLMPEDQQLFLKHNPSKSQYLNLKKLNMDITEDLHACQPSDSEDEDLEVSSSSDEEGNILDFQEEDDEEEEEEDQEEESMFQMF